MGDHIRIQKNEHLSGLMKTLKVRKTGYDWAAKTENYFESEAQPNAIKVKTGSTLQCIQCLMMMELLQATETHRNNCRLKILPLMETENARSGERSTATGSDST